MRKRFISSKSGYLRAWNQRYCLGSLRKYPWQEYVEHGERSYGEREKARDKGGSRLLITIYSHVNLFTSTELNQL